MLIRTPLLHQSFGPRVCLSVSHLFLSLSFYFWLIPQNTKAGCVTQGILASFLLSLARCRLWTTRFRSNKGPTSDQHCDSLPQWLQGWWANRDSIYNLAHWCALVFSLTLNFNGTSFSCIPVHAFFVLETLQGHWGSILGFWSFWIRCCSLCEYSFGMLADFEIPLFRLKLTEMPLAHSFGKKCCFSETFLFFSAIGPFLWHRGCYMETGWKAFGLAPLGPNCFLRTGWY